MREVVRHHRLEHFVVFELQPNPKTLGARTAGESLAAGVIGLAELANDMAAVFDEDRATVEASLVDVARSLGRLGLLDGVDAQVEPDA